MDKKKGSGYILWLLKALITAFLITGIGLFVVAFLLYKFHIGENQVVLGVNAIYVLSTFVGGWIIGKLTGRRKWIWGLLSGIFYFCLLAGISIALSKGFSSGMTNVMTVFVLCMCGGTIGGMVAR